MIIIVTDEAWKNLFQILEYLDENWSHKFSDDFEENVFQTISNIHDFPEMYLEVR